MASLNKVLLIGNLGRDPEVRMTPSGQKVANFAIATTERFQDKSGQRQERTEWHNIVSWGKQAEFAERFLRKGINIYVEGKLQTRSWDDQATGKKNYRTEIVSTNFQILTPRSNQGGPGGFDNGYGNGGGAPAGNGGYSNGAAASSSGPSYDDAAQSMADDDLPF